MNPTASPGMGVAGKPWVPMASRSRSCSPLGEQPGPPQLVGDEQQDQDAERDEGLADAAHDPAAAGARRGRRRGRGVPAGVDGHRHSMPPGSGRGSSARYDSGRCRSRSPSGSATSRPRKKKPKPSPKWFGGLILGLLFGGVYVILAYYGLLPGGGDAAAPSSTCCGAGWG